VCQAHLIDIMYVQHKVMPTLWWQSIASGVLLLQFRRTRQTGLALMVIAALLFLGLLLGSCSRSPTRWATDLQGLLNALTRRESDDDKGAYRRNGPLFAQFDPSRNRASHNADHGVLVPP